MQYWYKVQVKPDHFQFISAYDKRPLEARNDHHSTMGEAGSQHNDNVFTVEMKNVEGGPKHFIVWRNHCLQANDRGPRWDNQNRCGHEYLSFMEVE